MPASNAGQGPGKTTSSLFRSGFQLLWGATLNIAESKDLWPARDLRWRDLTLRGMPRVEATVPN